MKNFEMTLDQWCGKLPDFHQVNKQLKTLQQENKELKQQLDESTKTAYTDCPVCGCETAGTNELAINKEIYILRQKLSEQAAHSEELKNVLCGFERGVDLWLPETVLAEHHEGAKALHLLRTRLLIAIKSNPSPELLRKIQADAIRDAAYKCCVAKKFSSICDFNDLMLYADKLGKGELS